MKLLEAPTFLMLFEGNGDEWVQKHEFKMLLGLALRF